MPGYLLDTNHVSQYERQNAVLLARLRRVPRHDIIWLSPITLGEIEFGLQSAEQKDVVKQAVTRAFVSSHEELFPQPMDPTTGESYGRLMAEIVRRYPKPNAKDSTQEFLTELGVDINDAWLAATAMTHNLIFVTSDEMAIIRECATELRFQNWLV